MIVIENERQLSKYLFPYNIGGAIFPGPNYFFPQDVCFRTSDINLSCLNLYFQGDSMARFIDGAQANFCAFISMCCKVKDTLVISLTNSLPAFPPPPETTQAQPEAKKEGEG